ncbi:lactoylglutathione lyase-like isoform X2 [Hibiscus syriacus]|uniref:lactoylglutathione lyase-like isoform X2 n=1 Tax=Hibiscus syriacus TaxID=106335 RepID=UPI001922B7B9|nr:lactoylglutathione lyase-like isoform X2 [Hibiscus syriacus]
MASSGPKESAANNPGLQTPPEIAKGYFMQQTCFRIKDPKISLDFYSRILGMSLLKRIDVPDLKFTLYFMGYEDVSTAPSDPIDRTAWTFTKPATIELNHKWGTESDTEFKGYHTGNSEPLGFGHLGISVDDTFKACEKFARHGVEFVKTPEDGYALIKDPDGYWIEIFDLVNIINVVKGFA